MTCNASVFAKGNISLTIVIGHSLIVQKGNPLCYEVVQKGHALRLGLDHM